MVQDRSFTIVQEGPEDHAGVEALYDAAFGPGRFVKTAERLREGNARIPEASFLARDSEGVCAAVRLWPVETGSGGRAALLGPLAVAARQRGRGVAFGLMERSIGVCRELGFPAVILVGDVAYYERWAFRRAQAGRFQLPGPVDPARILVRDLSPDAAVLSGMLSVPRTALVSG